MKKKLPLDLVAISTNKVKETVKALKYSAKELEFNKIIFFTNEPNFDDFECIKIPSLKDVIQYNNIVLGLNKYIDSEHALIIQHDGHIVNPNMWSNEFLKYDYIGAPWPDDVEWNKRWNNYPPEMSKTIIKNLSINRIGNGGFSLRSKKFLEYADSFEKDFLKHGVPEDIFLNVLNFELSIDKTIKYPNVETAMKFSYETPLKGYKFQKPKRYHYFNLKRHFGWHGNHFLNANKLNNLKY